MKILQVMAGATHGGAETAFFDMCLALAEAGAAIEVVTRPNSPRAQKLEQAGIRVHALRFGGRFDILTRRRMRRIIGDFKPDIVQTWMSRAAQKTPRWTAALNIPRYLVVARLGGYYKMRNFRTADYFITITPDIKRYLAENGVPSAKIRAINNFAETEAVITPIDRAALDTPAGAPLLLVLGRLHKAKAIDTMLQATAQLSGVYLWIAGEGPDREALEALTRTLKIEDRVRFLGWRDDRGALLQACDICVFPSRYEPFGTVFVQAWAHGKPLVTTDADGPRQFVRDGEDGLIAPIDNSIALAAAIRALLADPAQAARLAAAGHQRYLSEFTKEKTVSAYLDFYRESLARESLPPRP